MPHSSAICVATENKTRKTASMNKNKYNFASSQTSLQTIPRDHTDNRSRLLTTFNTIKRLT
jgi:hypothetical protein